MQRDEDEDRSPRVAGESDAPDFFTVRERFTGGAIYTDVMIFLGEAALAGAIGGGAYDAVKVTVRKIAARLGERRQKDVSVELTREDAEELACAAIRLRFQFDAGVALVTEELTQVDDLNWSGRIRNHDDGEIYRVRLGPDAEFTKVLVRVSRA